MSEWETVNKCPEREDVLFGWEGTNRRWIGRMKRAVPRIGGFERDEFWGAGAHMNNVDRKPPTHWMPLPEPPK